MDEPMIDRTRVVKRLLPHQHGARKLAKRYGSMLVCVRYRHDPHKVYRYTTVELVVDATPIRPALFAVANFGIEVLAQERTLRRALRLAGGRFDPVDGLWWIRGSEILKLGLLARIRVK